MIAARPPVNLADVAESIGEPVERLSWRVRDGAVIVFDRPADDPDRQLVREISARTIDPGWGRK